MMAALKFAIKIALIKKVTQKLLFGWCTVDSSSGKTNSSPVLFPSSPQLISSADVEKQPHL